MIVSINISVVQIHVKIHCLKCQKNQILNDDEIDLGELFATVWSHKFNYHFLR